MRKKKVGLLFGGRSGEHEVSLASASAIAHGFDQEQFEIYPFLISREGKWYGPIPIEQIASAKADVYAKQEVFFVPKPGGQVCRANDGSLLCTLNILFPIVHGTSGEDGTLQGLLEMMGVPYVGTGVIGSAICMDKVVMRKILAYHQVPQVAFISVLRSAFERDALQTMRQIEEALSYPVFVKPANGGSSVGIRKARNREELQVALQCAAKYDRKLLIEQGIRAREIEISVLGNEEPKVSLPGEIYSSSEFYDYKAKYVDNKSITNIPAELPKEQIEEIQRWAVKAYQALECEGFARVDFFIDQDTNKLYLNEINTLPGFTEISMYPKMWEAAGKSMKELLKELIDFAELRFLDCSKNSIDCE